MSSTVDLTVLCWDHPRCTAPVTAAVREWERLNPGVRMRVTARPLASFNDQPLTEIAGSADLLFIDHPMVGEAAHSGALLPLDDLVGEDVLGALAADSVGASHATYTWDGRQWATAVDAACHVAVVDGTRAGALFQEVPRSWDDVLELARRAPGSVAIPLYPSDAVLSVLSITGNLRAHGEAADGFWSLEAVRIFCELVRRVDPRCFDLNPPRLLDLMSAGPAADAPVYAPLLFGYTNYQRPTAPGRRLSFVDVPSVGADPAGAVLGGAGLAVSVRSAHPVEAARFAAWLTGVDAQRGIVLPNEGQPGSRAVWHDEAADAVVGGFFSGTRATIESSHVRPRDPWWPGYQDAAGIALVDLLRTAAPPAAIHDHLTRMLDGKRSKEISQ
ncbi:extracellular solute-binding protein [Blastococcus deserti]|uniref:Extracellular solute-binding protein n=1 Tax=Blastococcus deserti TaxID=2259033 RepID=A0ABW4XFB7_9ACTN